MPERFRPDLNRRPPSPAEPSSRFSGPEDGQEDPLVELARIVSGPSSFDDARGRRDRAPAAFDENLESELTSHPADHNRPGMEPYGADLEWPRAEREPQPSGEEPDFDEFAHMHLRQPPRPEPRRAAGRSLAAPADGSWPPIDLDQVDPAPDMRDPIDRIEHAASVVGESRGAYGDYYADEQNDPLLIEGAPADDSYRPPGDGPDADFSVGRYGEEGFDPLPEYQDEPEPARSRGIGRGVLMAGAAAAVVILGGVGAIAYMSMDSGGSSGAPRVITADNNPVKVTPAPTGNATNTAAANNKLIYDRVDDPNGDRLKAGETPITTTPRADQRTTEASREISRIILPDSTGAGAPTAAGGAGAGSAPDTTRPTPAAGTSADGVPIGAKRVRTVVVRPDGTIISSGGGNDATAATASTAGRPAPGAGPAATGAPPATRSTTGATGPAAGTGAPSATGAPATTGAPLTANRTTTTTITTGQGVTTATSGAGNAAATTGNPTPRVAAREGGPISLVPNSGANAGQPAGRTASGGDGFVVQVTSQKSESAATTAYRDLQRRFPSLLGDKQPDMQRVDLGARGVFFRVRVGPVGTQEAAGSLCDNLKGAGADCVVVRN